MENLYTSSANFANLAIEEAIARLQAEKAPSLKQPSADESTSPRVLPYEAQVPGCGMV